MAETSFRLQFGHSRLRRFSYLYGIVGGTNSRIKMMKGQTYGFRDIEFFKLKIMALHETKLALDG